LLVSGILLTIMLVPQSPATPAFAVDFEFDVKITDFYLDNNYKVCLAEEGFLPTPGDCIDHTGRELAAGDIPYFIAQGSEVGISMAISVEDTTNKTIIYRHLDDMQRI
jgi:hypothetical protein